MSSFYDKTIKRESGAPALETIQDQKKDKYQPLEDMLYELQVKARNGVSLKELNSIARKTAPPVFRDLFNTSTKLIIDPGGEGLHVEYLSQQVGSMLTPAEARENILIMVRDEREVQKNMDTLVKIHKHSAKPIGVDLRNGRLKCKYGQVECSIHVGLGLMSSKILTTSMLTGAVLHEVGHVFNDIIYSNVFDSQFMNLSVAASTVRKKTKDDPDFHMVGALGDAGVLTDAQVKAIEKDDNARLPLDAVGMVYGNFQSSLLKMGRNNHESEKLADTFAARCGYGSELILLFHHFPAIREENRGWWKRLAERAIMLIFSMITILFFIGWLAMFGVPLVAAAGIVLTISVILRIRSIYLSKDGGVHPDDADRKEFLIQDMIARAKKSKWQNKKELQMFINDLLMINSITGSTDPADSFVSLTLRPRSRKHHKDMARLFNNTMFVDALELKLLTL